MANTIDNAYWILDELNARKNDTQIALIHRDRKITFADLWEKSEKIAAWILNNSKNNTPVVIYGNKDIEIVLLMIAALKSGRAYVPLDITYPVHRVEEIVNELGAEFLFVFEDTDFAFADTRVIYSEELNELFEYHELAKVDPIHYIGYEDNCYILFTSGSTGRPKGVQITKKNILNFVGWFSRKCKLSQDSRVILNQVSYSFDVSVIPLYIYMPKGNTLFCIDKQMLENMSELFIFLKESSISAWISTPTLLEICMLDNSFTDKLLPYMELVVLAGEVFTKELASSIIEKFNNVKMINGYGPTEGTVLLSACEITEDLIKKKESLPIGKILDDGEYSIVDEQNRPVKSGEIGELVVVSDSISKGYINNKAQTDKVFFDAGDGRKGYHTGDLVFEKDELIYYVARKDTQIKLNGFRIEMTDISNNLNKLDNVNNSVVLPVYRNGKIAYLAGFVVLKERLEDKPGKTGIALKKKLKALIPSYMVPRKIIVLDEFPMNINGKIDKKKLAEEYL